MKIILENLSIDELKESTITKSKNTLRLQNHLNKTKISQINFLYRNLNHTNGMNKDRHLSREQLIQKLLIVTENLAPIATELFTERNQIPNAKIAVCNQSLSRNANKKTEGGITLPQQIFIEAIAYGTTLEKLQKKIIQMPNN